MKKVAVVTGGSSGIGLTTAKAFCNAGYVVYSLSRSAPKDENIIHIKTDVSIEAQVATAIEQIIQQNPRIDVLVNNAGFGISGAVETTEITDAKRQFDINFFGTHACIKQVLPHMRAAGDGHIINISSVAAVLPLPYQAFYSAVKSAVNALTLALANEVSGLGIKVCAVMPGDVRTAFTQAREKNEPAENPYKESESRAVGRMEKDEQAGMSPEKVAKLVVKIAGKKRVKPLYTVGGSYKVFVLLSKILPTGLVNKVEGLMYG